MKPDKEIKKDLIAVWNKIEETNTSLLELTDAELIECRKSIQKRMELTLTCLGKYLSEEDIIEELNL